MRKGPEGEPDRQPSPGVGESEIAIYRDGRLAIVRVTAGLAKIARALDADAPPADGRGVAEERPTMRRGRKTRRRAGGGT